MASVARRLFINLNNGKVTETLTGGNPIQVLELKARDSSFIGFQAHRDGVPELLQAGSTLAFGFKAKNDFGGDFLVSASSFTNATTINNSDQVDTDFYRATLDLNTTPIITALGDDNTSIAAAGELEIDIGGVNQPFTSLTINLTIFNDYIRGGEGVPTSGSPVYPDQQEVIRNKSSGSVPAISSMIGNGSADLDSVTTSTSTAGIVVAVIDEDVNPAQLRHLRLEEGTVTETAATADAGTDVITATAHGLTSNDRIQFFTDDTLPDGLVLNTVYFAGTILTNSFQVFSVSGPSTLVDILDTGTGSHTVYKVTEPFEVRPVDYDASTNARSWQLYFGSNYNHPDHTGHVTSTGDGDTVIQSDTVTAAMMAATGTPDSTKYLAGDDTWKDADGFGNVSVASTITDTAVVVGDGGGKDVKETNVKIDGSDNMSGIVNITLSGTVDTRDIAADGDTLDNLPVSNLADGTDGELITWDAAGAPTTVAVGVAGHILTSAGVGAPPSFAAPTTMTIQRFVDFSINAGSWTPSTTDGATGSRVNYGDNDIDSFLFDSATEESVNYVFQLPLDYAGGVLRWNVDWDAIATASGTAVWGLAGVALANSDPLSTSVGVERTVSGTLTSVGDRNKSPNDATGITLAGSPAAGDLCVLRLTGKNSGTIAVDTIFTNLQLQYETLATQPGVFA